MSAEKSKDPAFIVAVEPRAARAVSERLAALGPVEQLDGQRLLLRTRAQPTDPKDMWSRVVESSGADVKVYPVVVNEAGDELFPTGSVAVRFATTPTDADLARFVAEHKLQIRARNSYVPRQVAFDAVSATRFLPDVLSELEQDDTVERVWPETISQYRRG